jgi:hypothetical protein
MRPCAEAAQRDALRTAGWLVRSAGAGPRRAKAACLADAPLRGGRAAGRTTNGWLARSSCRRRPAAGQGGLSGGCALARRPRSGTHYERLVGSFVVPAQARGGPRRPVWRMRPCAEAAQRDALRTAGWLVRSAGAGPRRAKTASGSADDAQRGRDLPAAAREVRHIHRGAALGDRLLAQRANHRPGRGVIHILI